MAYSGGVDSTLVAAIAYEAKGEAAHGGHRVCPRRWRPICCEKQESRPLGSVSSIANAPQLNWMIPDYSTNPVTIAASPANANFTSHLQPIAAAAGGAQVIDGVNLDDLADHRPGIAAAREAGVRSPLAELLHIDKATDSCSCPRALGFPWWDKPAQPCLASRFPYGESDQCRSTAAGWSS